MEVDLGDPGRDEDALRERAGEPVGPTAESLAIGEARRTAPARRRRSGNDAAAGTRVDSGQLASHRSWRPVERVASGEERAPVGCAGQRDLDLDDNVAFAGLGRLYLVGPEIARGVDA
jgi:hypothetical protein